MQTSGTFKQLADNTSRRPPKGGKKHHAIDAIEERLEAMVMRPVLVRSYRWRALNGLATTLCFVRSGAAFWLALAPFVVFVVTPRNIWRALAPVHGS